MGRVVKGAHFRTERYALEVPEIAPPVMEAEIPAVGDFESPDGYGFGSMAAEPKVGDTIEQGCAAEARKEFTMN